MSGEYWGVRKKGEMVWLFIVGVCYFVSSRQVEVGGQTKIGPRKDTAAQWSFSRCVVVFIYLLLFIYFSSTISLTNRVFSGNDLLKIRVCNKSNVTTEFICSHNIPADIVRAPHGLPLHRWDGTSALLRLGRQSFRPPLPNLLVMLPLE